ncbi:Cro/CI family transcriptional regulator [Shewanella baltica]|uniref:Cro/CI family transcriptional regulator n=1 Tax=Shewanella baltica TaxID=62322 RepID=UPI00216822D3|nr:Cro/CI family transcriptional regulator [Shewanella baltica]MCS6114488.1 Cro/Cl family transcriptional regulator [Shewanella baltica]UVW65394.1 Cro/Cl family transcriptional regulator [Shewanella baltica]
MKTKDAISHFGNKLKLAKALNVSKSAISQWGDDVPELRAFQIERLTDGQLMATALQLANPEQAA